MKPESNDRILSILTRRVIHPSEEFLGKQALLYAPGISAKSVGAQGIHLQLVTIPPGGRAKAHKHAGHETARNAERGGRTGGGRVYTKDKRNQYPRND